MKRTAGIRPASRRSLWVSSSLSLLPLVGLTLALAGCPPETVDPGNGNGNGNGNGDDDGGTPLDDTVTAVAAEIADGHLDSPYLLDATGSLNPAGRVLVYLWEVDAPEGTGCDEGEIADASSPLTSFTPGCRGVHRVTLTVTLVDGSETSKAERSFSVENRAPVLDGLEQENTFLPGVDVVISATVTDDDGDPITCTARLADDNAGDPTGFVIPSAPSSECSFTITTPMRVDTWKVEVVANDGYDDSQRSTVELTPGNDPPVIDDVTVDSASVPYACADDACAATTVRVTVTAHDDSDDFEELGIELVDVTETPPEGVVVDVTPVVGTHGAFDVVVSRADLGAMAGSYVFEARVTEVTAEDTPATVTQGIAFDVSNSPPVIDAVTADDVAHAYEAALYTAMLTVAATTSDPEANALTTTIELLSCPTAAAGEAACGGADLTIDETASDGQLVLALEATDLAKLAGEYGFRVTVTDADGAAVVEEPTLTVLNAAPALATGFTSPVQQAYIGSVHQATTPLLYDPDGDPMTMTLSATCADGSTIASLPGTCASDQAVSVSAAGVLTVSGPATGLLGDYRVQGNVTDGALSFTLDATMTVENTPPTLVRTSVETAYCDHEYMGNYVESESGCTFPFTGTAADANGDPLVFNRRFEPANGYSSQNGFPANVAVAGDGAIDAPLRVEVPTATFFSTFNTQTQRLLVEVEDPFGDTATTGMNPRLLNRSPVFSSKLFRNTAGTGAPAVLQNTEFLDGASPRARYYDCGLSCSLGNVYRFALDVNATDPDGDPLEVDLAISCSDIVERYGGTSATAQAPLPSGGLIQLMMEGSVGFCGGPDPDSFREWVMSSSFVCSGPGNCTLVPYFGCTLTGASSKVTDTLADVSLGSDLSQEITLADTSTPLTCQ